MSISDEEAGQGHKYLIIITPNHTEGVIAQVGDMNPWGQGYTQ
jgi:hypothetical protein